MENVSSEEKIGAATLQLEGEAIQWHLSFMRYRQHLHPASWNDYIMALVERFGTDFDDHMEEIKKVKQVGCVKEGEFILRECYQLFSGRIETRTEYCCQNHKHYNIISSLRKC